MGIILVLIAFSFSAIILGKLNWKSEIVKYAIIIIISLSQTLYVLYKLLTMEPPW